MVFQPDPKDGYNTPPPKKKTNKKKQRTVEVQNNLTVLI